MHCAHLYFQIFYSSRFIYFILFFFIALCCSVLYLHRVSIHNNDEHKVIIIKEKYSWSCASTRERDVRTRTTHVYMVWNSVRNWRAIAAQAADEASETQTVNLRSRRFASDEYVCIYVRAAFKRRRPCMRSTATATVAIRRIPWGERARWTQHISKW